MGTTTPVTFYAIAKDFQPLVAALVALAAAITAYLSQSETALGVQQRQFQEKNIEEEQVHHRRELAMMIRLGMKFQLMNSLLSHRVHWIRHVEERCSTVQGESDVYLIPTNLEIWQWFKEARSVVKEAEIYDSKQEDIEYLDPT